jgi:membrane protein required for beta-lactamase induction
MTCKPDMHLTLCILYLVHLIQAILSQLCHQLYHLMYDLLITVQGMGGVGGLSPVQPSCLIRMHKL